jgi:hypothetical protein
MNNFLGHPTRTLTFALCLCFVALSLLPSEVQARSQRGYIKKNGTYVQPHQKTNPDGKRYNNRSSQSNGGSQRDEFSSTPKYNKRRG